MDETPKSTDLKHGAGLLRSTNRTGVTVCHPHNEQVLTVQITSTIQYGLE